MMAEKTNPTAEAAPYPLVCCAHGWPIGYCDQCRADHFAKVHADNLRMRDKLFEMAKECGGCDGTGMITVSAALEPAFGKVLPCPDCEDILDVLGYEKGKDCYD